MLPAMKILVLAAIRFYQRIISPRKGFCCAYAAYTGHASCSALGYRAVRRFGAWHGLLVLNGRLEKCSVAYRRYKPLALQGQAGFLDCDCGGGDCGDCDLGDCSWESEKKKKRRNRNDERDVILPPSRR
jgi:putative component of membrane protein insertase Oxa1/YidC/SpoIIIJ protein YidD